MNIIETLEREEVARLTAQRTIPDFAPGDTVIVNVKVKEGERARVQVRKISYGEGVERVFPIFSPNIDSIKVLRRGKVRRAKLYYLRDRRGKSARIAERIDTKPKAKAKAPVAPAAE